MGLETAIIGSSLLGAGGGLGAAALSNSSGGGGGEIDLMSPKGILNTILALSSMANQDKLNKEYIRRADQQIADATGVASQIGPETLGAYDQASQQSLNELEQLRKRMAAGASSMYDDVRTNRGSFLSDFDQRATGLLGGYRDRYNRAEQDIAGYGRQMQADIDEGAAKRAAQFALNPLSRGSTIASSVLNNIEQNRTAEQRRLGEDLTRSRVNLLSGLSGDTLAAQGGLDAARQQYDSAMRGDILNTRRWGMDLDAAGTGNLANYWNATAGNRSGLIGSGLRDYLGVLTGINYVPPQQSQVPALMGQGMVSGPEYPNGMWPGVTAGVGQGANTAMMAYLLSQNRGNSGGGYQSYQVPAGGYQGQPVGLGAGSSQAPAYNPADWAWLNNLG